MTPEDKLKLRERKRKEYIKRKGFPEDYIFVERKTHCEICFKEIPDNYRWSKILCQLCGRREYKKKNPQYLEKERKRQLSKYREKKGLPLDTPFLIGRPGKGSREKHGYKTLYKPGHVNAKNKLGRVYEHVFVMSEYLGRPLFKGETIHHKNGDRMDNRIENLELWDKKHPPGQRLEDKIKFYIEFLEQNGYKMVKE